MADSSADDSLKKSQAAADLMRQAGAMAFDTIRVFTGMQQVAATGKPGALALVDTLATAPVGDAAKVRDNIGVQEAGKCTLNESRAYAIGVAGSDGKHLFVRTNASGEAIWYAPSSEVEANASAIKSLQGERETDASAIKSLQSERETDANAIKSLQGERRILADAGVPNRLHVAPWGLLYIDGGDSDRKYVLSLDQMTSFFKDNVSFAMLKGGYTASAGTEVSGSDLYPCSAGGWGSDKSAALSGRWICLGMSGGNGGATGVAAITLWVKKV